MSPKESAKEALRRSAEVHQLAQMAERERLARDQHDGAHVVGDQHQGRARQQAGPRQAHEYETAVSRSCNGRSAGDRSSESEDLRGSHEVRELARPADLNANELANFGNCEAEAGSQSRGGI